MYVRKVLFASKLSLVLLLSYVVIRAVLPDHTAKNLTPASALGGETLRSSEVNSPLNLSAADYSVIVEKNPFDASGQAADSGKGKFTDDSMDDRSVSEELGLTLLGTVAGSPEVARAIIKNLKTGKADLYRIDQTVANARIKSIEKDAVILLHEGQIKILRLDTVRSGGRSNNNTQISLRRTANAANSIVATEPAAQRTETTRTGTRYLEAILNKAVIEPNVVAGQTEGLKITGLENIKEAAELGLKNGDVIRSINGNQLTDKQQAFQVLQKSKSQAVVNVEMLRGNETKKLSYVTR